MKQAKELLETLEDEKEIAEPFKFAQRVLVGEFDSEEPDIPAVFWKMDHNFFKVILPSGDYGSFHYCKPNPNFHALEFVRNDHDGDPDSRLPLGTLVIGSNGQFDQAEDMDWDYVDWYAIWPDWMK